MYSQTTFKSKYVLHFFNRWKWSEFHDYVHWWQSNIHTIYGESYLTVHSSGVKSWLLAEKKSRNMKKCYSEDITSFLETKKPQLFNIDLFAVNDSPVKISTFCGEI